MLTLLALVTMNSDVHSELQPYLRSHSLEADFESVVYKRQQRARSNQWPKRLCVALLNFFTGQQTLSIRQVTKNDQKQWIVYDPSKDERKVFDTEQAVRSWLETRE